MRDNLAKRHVSRRDCVASLVALSGLATAGALLKPAGGWAKPLSALDPQDAGIRYGITGALWGTWPNGNLRMSTDLARIASDAAHAGLQGIEPYGSQIDAWLGKPLALRRLCNHAGVTLIDVGDLPAAWRPSAAAKASAPHAAASNPPPNPWIDEEGNAELIARMVSFARDFLVPCGCDHWKTNMGSRPPGGPTGDQLKRLADTLNEIGRQTIRYGIRLAPHPHIWGPMEREHEVRTVLAHADPRYVWLTLDTGHLTLGGMDAVKIVSDYLSRIAEVHLKDTYPKFRGNHATPTRAEHQRASLYGKLGTGGVNFPAIMKVLRARNFKGWVALDLDAPRPNDGTGSIEDNLDANVRYLRDVLHVNLPAPRRNS
jgi:sugar phosphate isomerase/epimerase